MSGTTAVISPILKISSPVLRLRIQTDGTSDVIYSSAMGDGEHVVGHQKRSILPDLSGHSFPDDIKNQADTIYQQMRPRVRKGKARDQLLFFCVYYAHIELDVDVDPNLLGERFGLKPGEVQRCHSIFSPLQTGYHPPLKDLTPLNLLPDYMKKLNMSEDAIYQAKVQLQEIVNKNRSLSQEHPRTVASGFLKYYIDINGIEVNQQELSRITNRSPATIDNMYNRISMIDNS